MYELRYGRYNRYYRGTRFLKNTKQFLGPMIAFFVTFFYFFAIFIFFLHVRFYFILHDKESYAGTYLVP